MNGLRHNSSQKALFRKAPSTMEESIEIAFVEEQSYNSASAMLWLKSTTKKFAATTMELGNADFVCYMCSKCGHMMACCYAHSSYRC